MSWDPIPMEHLYGLALPEPGVFAFSGKVKHGSGKRNVQVTVKPDVILRLAALMKTCPKARPGTAEFATGHVEWHFNHPGRPCNEPQLPKRPRLTNSVARGLDLLWRQWEPPSLRDLQSADARAAIDYIQATLEARTAKKKARARAKEEGR